MRTTTTFKRLLPDTINGEQIAVTIVYSSFDASEIDRLEMDLRKSIGFCITGEVGDKEYAKQFMEERSEMGLVDTS